MGSQMVESLIAYPLTPLVLSLLISTFAIGLTSNNSLFRPTGLLAIAYCVHYTLENAKRILLNSAFSKGLMVGSTAGVFLAYLDIALLSNWTFEAQGPTSSRGGQTILRTAKESKPISKTFFQRLYFGFGQCFRARMTGTPWEVNHVPPFFRDRPGVLPSRGEFLYSTGSRLLVNLLLLDAIGLAGRDTSLNSINFDSNRILFFSRLGEITMDEFIFRGIGSVVNWVAVVLFLQTMYDGAAFIVIGLGLSKIAHWPPLFGHYTETWSIRQFWGTYWHQTGRQKFSAPANFVYFSVLRLQKGTILARYALLTGTFLVSGFMHQFGDIAMGVPWSEAGAVRFFAMQAVGIIIEDSVQGLFRWIYQTKRTAEQPTGWKRGIGYVWVLAWLIWTTPVWMYPTALRSTGEGILPYSLLRRFVE